MADKIEYSRMLVKRTAQTGEVPTIPPITATTLNQMIPTDLFVGEFFLNEADDLLWIRTDNGILPISLSGSTGSTPTLTEVLFEGNVTNGYDIVVSSGDTITFEGIPSGVTTTILGLDASGNTITTTGGGGTQDLSQVLAQGNTTNGYDIVVSTGDTITSPSGENEISLQDIDSLLLQSTYTLSGTNYKEQIKMRAPSPTDASLELISYDLTNNPLSKTEYRPTSIKDFSFDSVGSFVETRLESSGFTIDLSNTSAGYLTIDGLLPGTATDLLGLDSNNRVVPVDISGLTTPDLSQVLSQGNTTNGNDIVVSSGDTIQYQGLTTGITTDFLAIDGFGNTIITSGGANGTSGTSGTSGSSGINGTSGTSGTSGSSGINGTNGTSGTSGVNGDAGSSGTSGVNGTSGTNGTSGVNGTSGTNGSSGINGTSGTNGVNGTSGTNGSSGTSGVNLWTSGSTIGSVTTTASLGTTNTAPYSLVIGTGNTVTQTHSTQLASNIVGGLNNIVNSAGSIVVGFNNNVDNPVGAAVFGSTNTAIPNYSTIFGVNNSITGGTFSFVAGGSNKINSGSYSAILGGTNNVLSSGDRSVILGGQGITGTSSNMVFVPNLTIASATTGTSIASLGIDATGKVITTTTPTALGSFGITIDGGGSAITTGVKGYIVIPYNCTITGWTILGDVSGSIVVDVWKDTYANFPPTVADTIAGTEKPTLSSAIKNEDNTLTTWTTSVSSGDIIGFNVDSASTVTRVNLSINVIKS